MSGVIDSTIVWLTFRQLFAKKRLVASALFALAPAIIAAIYRIGHSAGDPANAAFLLPLYRDIVLGTLLPLAAAVFGTSAFGGEVDDGTIVYLLVKPVARWRMVLSKYVVAVLSTAAIMVPGVLLPWLIVDPGAIPFSTVLSFATGIGVGCVLYCALFLVLGLTSKRALVIALLYIVLVEEVLSRNIAGLKSFSIREFGLSVTQHAWPSVPALNLTTVTTATVWTMGAIIFAGALAMAVRKLSAYEMAEKL